MTFYFRSQLHQAKCDEALARFEGPFASRGIRRYLLWLKGYRTH
jgi:hypothetical protein